MSQKNESEVFQEMVSMKIDVLGVPYDVRVGKRKEVELPKELNGQCAHYLKRIDVEHSMRECNTETERDGRTVGVIAHEVFHAFAHESGLNLEQGLEEDLAVWYEKMWRKMNNCILSVLDAVDLVDV